MTWLKYLFYFLTFGVGYVIVQLCKAIGLIDKRKGIDKISVDSFYTLEISFPNRKTKGEKYLLKLFKKYGASPDYLQGTLVDRALDIMDHNFKRQTYSKRNLQFLKGCERYSLLVFNVPEKVMKGLKKHCDKYNIYYWSHNFTAEFNKNYLQVLSESNKSIILDLRKKMKYEEFLECERCCSEGLVYTENGKCVFCGRVQTKISSKSLIKNTKLLEAMVKNKKIAA